MSFPALPIDGQTPWGDQFRDWAAAVEDAVTVRRHLLTGNHVVSTAGWPTHAAITLVFTQDATGGRTVTYDGEQIMVDETPGGETITAWVWTGTRWWVRSSNTIAPVAPEWVAGTTATTGDPDHEQVVVTFNQPIPGGTLQYRMGSGDTWRSITAATSTTVTLTGLSPLTAYAAPDFKVVNSAGETAIVTAQAFTTDVTPPGWVTVFHDTFTDADGTALSAHAPDYTANVGWNKAENRPLYNTIYGNRFHPRSQEAYGSSSATVGTDIVVASKKIRVTGSYVSTVDGLNFGPYVWLNNAAQFSFGPSLKTGQEITGGGLGVPFTETTGRTTVAPQSADWVLEFDATSATLWINGVLERNWTVDWGGRNITAVWIGGGGNDLYSGMGTGTPSNGYVDNVRIEHWQ